MSKHLLEDVKQDNHQDSQLCLPKKKRRRKTKQPLVVQRSQENPFLLGDIVYRFVQGQHYFGKITKITPTNRYRILHVEKSTLQDHPKSTNQMIVVQPDVNQRLAGGGTLAKLIEGLLCFKDEYWALYNCRETYVDKL